MTRRIALLVLFLFLITLGTYEIIAVNHFLTHMEHAVDQIKIEIVAHKEDLTVIYDQVSKEKDYWEKHENSLNLMFNHKDLQTICDTLNRIRTYVSENDYDNAIVDINVLIETVYELRPIMGFNIDNIL